jgi:[ribosomal protein S18]-alanine N-acetyltransferase
MFFGLFRRKIEHEIVAMTTADAAIAAAIHSSAFSHAWSDGEFSSLIGQPAVFGFFACRQGKARDRADGFVLVREAAGEAEILTICVRPDAQRNSLGWRLMRAAIREAVNRGAGEMFLEVDETNTAAIALYQKLDFRKVGERKAYYQNQESLRTAAHVMRAAFGGRS